MYLNSEMFTILRDIVSLIPGNEKRIRYLITFKWIIFIKTIIQNVITLFPLEEANVVLSFLTSSRMFPPFGRAFPNGFFPELNEQALLKKKNARWFFVAYKVTYRSRGRKKVSKNRPPFIPYKKKGDGVRELQNYNRIPIIKNPLEHVALWY